MTQEDQIVVRTDDENASMDLEIIDGCLVNPDGEVVGTVEFEAIDEIADEATADAIVGRIAEIQSRMLALRVRRDAVMANFAGMERQVQARLDYMTGRFTPILEAYAARRLKFSKKRSFDMANGRVGFRKHPGSARVKDMEKCLAFLRQIGRDDLIRSETKTVEKVAAAEVAEVVDRWEGADDVAPSALDFLERTPPGDRFRIETGILD